MNFEKFVHQIFLNSYLCSNVSSQSHQSSSAAFSEWLPKQWWDGHCNFLNESARGPIKWEKIHVWNKKSHLRKKYFVAKYKNTAFFLWKAKKQHLWSQNWKKKKMSHRPKTFKLIVERGQTKIISAGHEPPSSRSNNYALMMYNTSINTCCMIHNTCLLK